MTKKNNNKKKISKKNEERDVKKEFASGKKIKEAITIVSVLLVIMALFYAFTLVLTNRKDNTIKSNSSIQYTKILAGEALDMNEDKYIVFLYDSEGENSAKYSENISKYRDKDKHLTVYTVDLKNGLNKKYIDKDKENVKVDNINNLKIKGDTIVLVKDKKIEEYATSEFEEFLDNHVE